MKEYLGRWRRRGLDADDLFQEGCVGLAYAATHFDPARGTKFSSFAGTCIRNEILKALRHHRSVFAVTEADLPSADDDRSYADVRGESNPRMPDYRPARSSSI